MKKEGHEITYLTIDDLRLWKKYGGIVAKTRDRDKTNILIYNRTWNNAEQILAKTDVLVVVLGVHVPGKYLTGLPGTLHEVIPLIRDLR
ncbi:hypothetical protein J4210_00525, partial [Candidatus Woesearchaeota archaeon]|nr:hypothetical protein [Candidatus Woesearchaeota archaeon]